MNHKVLLVDIRKQAFAINKDMAGGFGTSSKFGNGSLNKLLGYLKAKNIFLPNLNLAYIAAIFHKNNWEVSFTTNSNDYRMFFNLVILYCSIPEYTNELVFIKKYKNAHPQSIIGIVGCLPTVCADMYSKKVDFIIQGEPEFALLSLAKFNINIFSGVIPSSTINVPLKNLPFPYWKPFLEKYYFLHTPLLENGPMLSVYASRGCPMTCSYYCPYPLLQGKKIRLRSPTEIIIELKKNIQQYKIKRFLFRDPNFGINKTHLKLLLTLIIREKLNIYWAAEMMISTLNKEIILLMKKSGCSAITIGIESPNTSNMLRIKRKVAQEDEIIKKLHLLDKHEIKVMAGYILGSIDETLESMQQTLAFAKKLNTSYAQFSISTPYFGTQYYADLKSKINSSCIEDWGTDKLVFRHRNLSAQEVVAFRKKCFKEYYFRCAWLFKHLRESIHDLLYYRVKRVCGKRIAKTT